MATKTTYFRALLLGLTLAAAGCPGDRDPADRARDGQKKGAASGKKALRKEKTNLRAGHYRVASLLSRASRAELRLGPHSSLLMDFGSPDQHKFTRGGWSSGWLAAAATRTEEDSPTVTAMARRATVEFVSQGAPARAVLLRARALGKGQRLSLSLDGAELGEQALSQSLQTLAFALGEPLTAGRHRLSLSLSRGSRKEDAPAAELDWLWLAPTAKARPPAKAQKVAVRTLDGPRRALVADPPRRFSYHLAVPEGAVLLLDTGAKKPTRFRVELYEDDRGAQTLLDRTSSAPRWEQARLDLSRWAGRVVRLDLISEGPAGEAGWAEPELARAGKAPSLLRPTAKNRPKSVIYLLIDTARQDAFRPFNPQTRVKAPALARFAAEAVRFESAYATDNWTKPSVASIWSGLYSSTHRTQGEGSVLPGSVPLVQEELRRRGFTTAAFIANGYVSHKFGFRRGWDTYRNYIREDRNYDAEKVFADALTWLKSERRGDKPFYLYIQTIDPHVPYAVPKKYLEPYYPEQYRGRLGPSVSGYETKDWLDGKIELTDDDKRYIEALYHGEITYHDEHFGRFLAAIEELGLSDDTLFVVSNDHGEEMFEHGKVGHGHSLYEELIRSPLMLRLPGLLPAGEVVRQPVELVDLLPTLLWLLGQPPMAGVEGASLRDVLSGRPLAHRDYALAEFRRHSRAVRFGPYKLILTRDSAELFHLGDDPGEQRDLSRARPIARRAAEVHLYEGLATPRKALRLRSAGGRQQHQAGETRVEGELRRQLEALGYIQ